MSLISKAFTALGLLAGYAGLAGVGPYFWLGKQVASVALLSAAILDNQEVGNPDPDAPLEGLARAAACDAVKATAVAGLTADGTTFGDIIGALDTANSVANLADGGVSCPSGLAGVGCK